MTDQIDGQSQSSVNDVQEPVVGTIEHTNRLVGTARKQGYEKGRQEALKEMQMQTPQQANVHSSNPSLGGMSFSPEMQQEIARHAQEKAREEAQRLFQEETKKHNELMQNMEAQRIVAELKPKVDSAREKYSDYNEVVSRLNLVSNPHLAQLANSVDNAGEVFYDWGKNPHKVLAVTQHLMNNMPELAKMELQNTSNSIKQNQDAIAKHKSVNAPLDQLKQTSLGADNGPMTVSDHMKLDYLKA